AKRQYESAQEICHRIGDRGREASALYDLGQVLRIEGDWTGSWQAESNAASIFQELGDRVPLAQVTLKQANLLLDQNKVEEAAMSVRQASDLLAKANALRDQAFAQIIFARTALSKGRLEEAASAIANARLFAQRSQDRELGLATAFE